MYKTSFIVFLGLFFILFSKLYGANTPEAPAENKANSQQKHANNAQNAGAAVVNNDSFLLHASPSRARSAPPPRKLCKKCKIPGHQEEHCPAGLNNRQPSLAQFKNSSHKPVYTVQQININNNTPQPSGPIGIANNSLFYNNLILYPTNLPLYNLCIAPPSNTQNNLVPYNMQHHQIYSNIINPPLYNAKDRSKITQTVNSTQQPLLPPPYGLHANKPKKNYDVWSCTSIRSCKALLTVITCLQYWHGCNDSSCLKNIFTYLSKANRYMDIVGAYHHLLAVHLNGSNSGEVYSYINAEVKKSVYCNFITCSGYTRNQRKRRERDNDNHQEYIFLRDLLDTIHAYLVHGYDSGHRYPLKDIHKRSKAAARDDEKEEKKK